MIASDWPFGLQKGARRTCGPARLARGHYLRVEEEGNEQMRKTGRPTQEKHKPCRLNWAPASLASYSRSLTHSEKGPVNISAGGNATAP